MTIDTCIDLDKFVNMTAQILLVGIVKQLSSPAIIQPGWPSG